MHNFFRFVNPESIQDRQPTYYKVSFGQEPREVARPSWAKERTDYAALSDKMYLQKQPEIVKQSQQDATLSYNLN